jgi:hypothetical protein
MATADNVEQNLVSTSPVRLSVPPNAAFALMSKTTESPAKSPLIFRVCPLVKLKDETLNTSTPMFNTPDVMLIVCVPPVRLGLITREVPVCPPNVVERVFRPVRSVDTFELL